MSTTPVESFRMETNFEGLIKLLAKHLYPEPDVFARELVQNGQDAIQRRLKIDPEIAGRIDVSIRPQTNSILFKDNGIGMDAKDIRDFLAVIGRSGTSETMQQWKAEGYKGVVNLIGQFGIGFLSGFLVANRIIVRTRKAGSPVAYRWENGGSLDCTLWQDDFPSIGTEVELFVSEQHEYFLKEQALQNVLSKYCGFIPVSIYLRGRGPINEIDAPFYRQFWQNDGERQAHYEAFVQRRYGGRPLAVIPVKIDGEYSASGVLFIRSADLPGMHTQGVVEILIRRMMIRHQDTNLLPQWAKFVGGVIDSPDLEPTASRDNYQLEHPSVEYLRQAMGQLIVEHLVQISKRDPDLLRRINILHHYFLKGMACAHPDFFHQVADLLLFDTNKGQMSLQDYLPKSSPRRDYGNRTPIYHFTSSGAATQFNRVANAKGWVVIDASDIFDQEFLAKYGEYHKDTTILLNLSNIDDPEVFDRLSASEEHAFKVLQGDVEAHLRAIGIPNVRVRVRKFPPDELPAILMVPREIEADDKIRRLRGERALTKVADEILSCVVEDASRAAPSMLLNLNANNSLVRKLASADRQLPGNQAMMSGLFQCAMVSVRHLVTPENMRTLQDQFIAILQCLSEAMDSVSSLTEQVQREHKQADEEAARHGRRTCHKPAHSRLFVITPFSRAYEPIEDALREVFETPPYCFEIRLARDCTIEPGLLGNIKEQMDGSHGFIAEITDLNPNVMFELGAVTLFGEGRPVLTLRSAESAQPVPANIQDKLRIEYASINCSMLDLAGALRASFERDGQIIHDSVRELLEERQKRFLSRRLLERVAVKLEDVAISRLRKEFTTIEDFLDANPRMVANNARLPLHLIEFLRTELEKEWVPLAAGSAPRPQKPAA